MASQVFSRFTTPSPRLVQVFERRRDRWKAKAIERNRNLKGVKNQVYAVTKSRDQWKEPAKVAQERIDELAREIAFLKCCG